MKKRVLLVTSGALDKTGVPSVIMTVVRELREDCAFDILLSGAPGGYFEEEFLGYGGRIFRYRKKRFRVGPLNTLADCLRPFAMFARTRRILRQNGPYDAVHCHNEFDMAGSLAAARLAGVPVRVGHAHKTWQSSGGPLTKIYRGLCRRTIRACGTALLGCSRQANETLYGPDASHRVVNNPYDERRFRCDAPGVREGPVKMVQVGYFCENKNQRFTLDVFSALSAAQPDARLTFVGDCEGGYGRAVKDTVRERGLQGRVTFLPPDADVPSALEGSNLMMLPSRSEGFGMTLIEGQAMGLACCASDTVPRETDRGGVSYLPLSAGPEAWAKAILDEGLYRLKIPRDCGPFSTAGFAENVRLAYGLSGGKAT